MKRVLITGASRGIGRAIAQELGRDHHVLVGATSVEGAQEVADSLPSAEPWVYDLASETPPPLDELDMLVHSAGILEIATIEQATREQWRRSFELNVFAVADLTRVMLPALRRTRGTVVTINSGSGLHSGANTAIYSGTKYALRAFADSLRDEELGRIRVTSIYPGRVDTDMQKALRRLEGHPDHEYDGNQWAKPESIAAAVRLVADLGPDASIPDLQVRPSGLYA